MVKLKLPNVLQVDDYHEFGEIERFLNQLTTEKVKVVELGLNQNNGRYVGLVYSGRKPNKEIRHGLLTKGKMEIEGVNIPDDRNTKWKNKWLV